MTGARVWSLVFWGVLIGLALACVPLAVLIVAQPGFLRPMLSRPVAAGDLRGPHNAAEGATVRVYFLARDTNVLGWEPQVVPESDVPNERVAHALEQLWRGPDSAELVPVVPTEIELLAVFIDPDLQRAYIDLSPGLRGIHLGPLAEWAMIFSIVNTTVAAVDGIRSVQLLCDGEPVRDWQGVWDLSRPFRFEDIRVESTPRKGERT